MSNGLNHWKRLIELIPQIATHLECDTGSVREILFSYLCGRSVRLRCSLFQVQIRDGYDEVHPVEFKNYEVSSGNLLGYLTVPNAIKWELDELSGDYYHSGQLDELGYPEQLCDVFHVKGLWLHADDVAPLLPQQISRLKASSRGRPPSDWWSTLAVELALITHWNGPPGNDSGDQAAFIGDLQEAVEAQGFTMPSRTRVQGLVRQLALEFERRRAKEK